MPSQPPKPKNSPSVDRRLTVEGDLDDGASTVAGAAGFLGEEQRIRERVMDEPSMALKWVRQTIPTHRGQQRDAPGVVALPVQIDAGHMLSLIHI